MHQNLRQQPISEASLDQYITEGLQKSAVSPQDTHFQAAQVLSDIRKGAGTEIILKRAKEVTEQVLTTEESPGPPQHADSQALQEVQQTSQTLAGGNTSHVATAARSSEGIQWSVIALGCLVFFLSSILLPFVMDSNVALAFSLVLASGFSAVRATNRKVLHAILTPVTYYLASLVLLMVLSIFAGA